MIEGGRRSQQSQPEEIPRREGERKRAREREREEGRGDAPGLAAVAAGGHAVRVQGTVHHGLPGDHGVGPGPASDDLHAVVELGDRAVNPA